MKNYRNSSTLAALVCGLVVGLGHAVVVGKAAQAAASYQAKGSQVHKAIFVRLKAKPGKEADLDAFLRSAKPLVMDEPATALWFALQFDAKTFAIFDAMPTEEGRDRHLAGKVAAALMSSAGALLEEAPVIEKADIIEKKVNRG